MRGEHGQAKVMTLSPLSSPTVSTEFDSEGRCQWLPGRGSNRHRRLRPQHRSTAGNSMRLEYVADLGWEYVLSLLVCGVNPSRRPLSSAGPPSRGYRLQLHRWHGHLLPFRTRLGESPNLPIAVLCVQACAASATGRPVRVGARPQQV